MRWEAALSLNHDHRCGCQLNDPEEHVVMEHATRMRQLHESGRQGLRESELGAQRPAKWVVVGASLKDVTAVIVDNVRDGADSEWIIQLVNTRNSLGRLRLYAARHRHSCQNQIVQSPQLLCLAVTGWYSDPMMVPLLPYSKGFVRVPHQVRKVASPMVSKALATAEIPTVSRARFSWNTWTMNCG